jgi:hypothetical protein
MGDLKEEISEWRKIHPDHHAQTDDIANKFAERLNRFHEQCLVAAQSKHEKTAALAKEFLNDWEAIFRVIRYPSFPLTNGRTCLAPLGSAAADILRNQNRVREPFICSIGQHHRHLPTTLCFFTRLPGQRDSGSTFWHNAPAFTFKGGGLNNYCMVSQ